MTDPKTPSKSDEQHEHDKWYETETTRFPFLLFAGGIALFGLVLGLILDWYIDPHTSTQKKDLVQALGLITAGVAGAIGIFFTWRGQRLARKAQEDNQRNTLAQLQNAEAQLRLSRQSQEQNQQATQAQLQNAQEELRLTRQGQITERFTRAIDQLGGGEGEKNSPEIRLGGIYALERIAKESKKDYYGVVMEVLTAYVRQHAPRQQTEVLSEQCIIGKNPSAPYPRSDIRAILTIIGRRDSYDDNAKEEPLDLHETDLHGAQLVEANLGKAIFVGADLRGTYLVRVDLTSAHLYRADLSGAILGHTDFSKASLQTVDLRWANLRWANFTEADLTDANLTNADLRRADLQQAFLIGTDLLGANLQEAILENAILQRANLQGADLLRAILQDAILQGAKVTDNQLADTRSLEGAIMPDGSKHP